MKAKIDSIYIKIILLFPLLTLFSGFLPSINKVFFGILIFLQFIVYSSHKISIKSFIILICTLLSYILSVSNTVFPLESINDLFYFASMALYFLYIFDNFQKFKDALLCNDKFIEYVLIIYSIVVITSAFFSSSWVFVNGSYSFVSFVGTTFRLCPTAIYIFSLAFLLFRTSNRKRFLLYLIVPLFCLFFGSSRTYFVVGVLEIFVLLYFLFNNKFTLYMSAIPIGLVIFFLALNSSIGDKFISSVSNVNDYLGFLGSFSGSRSIFWEADIKAYFEGGLFNRIFGYGFNFVYDINLQAVNVKIWAHNDFIQMILSFGAFGLILYIITFFSTYFKITEKIVMRSKMLRFLLFLIFFFNAFFNMFYTYFCSILSYPILLICFTDVSNSTLKEKKL